jgi:hypothetical protein
MENIKENKRNFVKWRISKTYFGKWRISKTYFGKCLDLTTHGANLNY